MRAKTSEASPSWSDYSPWASNLAASPHLNDGYAIVRGRVDVATSNELGVRRLVALGASGSRVAVSSRTPPRTSCSRGHSTISPLAPTSSRRSSPCSTRSRPTFYGRAGVSLAVALVAVDTTAAAVPTAVSAGLAVPVVRPAAWPWHRGCRAGVAGHCVVSPDPWRRNGRANSTPSTCCRGS